ncbi:hypothetical protein F5B20DRAFT_581038 [Whalleya microplaca]|nr:hypothetical protein F5B20DRAFT_581038 [Whalleya microplaca]
MLRPRATQLCQRALARPIPPRLLPPHHKPAIYRTAPIPPRALQLSASRLFTNSPTSRLAEQPPKPHDDATAKATPSTSPPPSQPQQPTEQPQNPPDPTAEPPRDPPPPRRPRRRGLYYGAAFLLAGIMLGNLFRFTIAPPPLPAPHTPEDAYLVSRIAARGARLPIVEALSADPAWTSWDAYSGLATSGSPKAVQSRITSGPMAGSNGLAFQRVFHRAETGEVVGVVYFGPGTAGWPGVVHGGALATVLDESLGRCAILRFPARTGVTARLELAYRAPALTNEFYVVRARPVVSEEDEVVGRDGVRRSERKLWVQGTLENDGGRVCVEAKALFVVPKGVKLKPLVEEF